MNKLTLLVLLTLFTSCAVFDSDEDYVKDLWAEVEKVEVASSGSGIISFNIDLNIPTPCHEFHRREVTWSGDTVYARYFSKIKKDQSCIQVTGNMRIRDNFPLVRNRPHVFRFWQSDEKYLDTLILIE